MECFFIIIFKEVGQCYKELCLLTVVDVQDSEWLFKLTRLNVMSSSGLDAELYYVRNNIVNHYALSFTLPVPSETNSLHFTWHSKTKVYLSTQNHERVCLY